MGISLIVFLCVVSQLSPMRNSFPGPSLLFLTPKIEICHYTVHIKVFLRYKKHPKLRTFHRNVDSLFRVKRVEWVPTTESRPLVPLDPVFLRYFLVTS